MASTLISSSAVLRWPGCVDAPFAILEGEPPPHGMFLMTTTTSSLSSRLARTLPFCILVGVLLSTTTVSFARVDLGRIYKATLDHEKRRPRGHDWTTSTDDVWELEQFTFVFRNQLGIRLGPSDLVFGRSGTNVVWAAVLPRAPGEIVAAPAGKGEKVTSVFMRFHPALVRQLFPAQTVMGQGGPLPLLRARRVYQYKINASWQSGNMPVIPSKNFLVLDCDTAAGKRRFFMVDTRARSVTDEPAFLAKPVPEIAYGAFESASPVELFDEVWQAFDREYATFGLKPELDWEALRDLYRPLAERVTGRYDAAAVLALLLSHLEDLHVSVKIENEFVWCYNRFRFLNANYGGIEAIVGKLVDTGRPGSADNAVRWRKTDGDIGYVAVMNLNQKSIPETFDRVLDELRETRGLILDLRFNGGGDELLARALAGRFIEKPAVYSYNQYRNGPKHDDLGEKLERVVEPRGPWRYDKPLVVLCGQQTMSSAESLVCMLAKVPGAVLVGDRTAGSSANPRLLQLPGKITVNLPRWLDMDHTGKPIEGRGVEPQVRVDLPAVRYASSGDPVVREALRLLRKR